MHDLLAETGSSHRQIGGQAAQDRGALGRVFRKARVPIAGCFSGPAPVAQLCQAPGVSPARQLTIEVIVAHTAPPIPQAANILQYYDSELQAAWGLGSERLRVGSSPAGRERTAAGDRPVRAP